MSTTTNEQADGTDSTLTPHTSILDYCEIHDLYYGLIPDPGRRISEWDMLREIKEFLQELKPYVQSTEYQKIADARPSVNQQAGALSNDYLRLCGSFRLRENSQSRWSNPYYAHGDEHIIPRESREVHVRNAMRLPTVSRTRLAERFDVTPKTLSNWMRERGFDFREEQHEAKKRIGRSILCSVEWADYSVMELRRAIPNVPHETVKDWVYVYGREDGWEVPDPPTDTKWFGRSRTQ